MSAYHARLAQMAMSNHRLNPACYHELARWADYAAACRLTHSGVLVTGDGRLHMA